MPKLKGKTLAKAKQALTQANCALGKVTKQKPSGTPGIVLSQKPQPGSEPPSPRVAVVVSTT